MKQLRVKRFTKDGALLGRGTTDEDLALDQALAEAGFAVWVDKQGFVVVDRGVRA